jgi:N6-adenosine-specific RNA methylase IME4
MPYKSNDKVGQLKLAIAQELLPNLPQIPINAYSLIVVDPPWTFNLRETDPTHRGRCPYPNMTDEAILNLPIGAIASSDAYLLLWVTNNHLPLGFRCLEKWGFAYKSIFTWMKTTKSSTVENPHPHIGIGHYGRNTTEHFLVATKGSPGSFTTHGLTDIPNVIFAPRSQHSKKPDEFWAIAHRLASYLDGEKIELFAREQRPGWEVWGAEVS